MQQNKNSHLESMLSGKKYFRVHTPDTAFVTRQPRGLFTAIGKLVDAGTLTEKEVSTYWENRHWFEEHLPIPPFYDSGNQEKAITWYKNNPDGLGMFRKMDFYFDMAWKYQLELWLTVTDSVPGSLIYQDEYQIGVRDSRHYGPEFNNYKLGHDFSLIRSS